MKNRLKAIAFLAIVSILFSASIGILSNLASANVVSVRIPLIIIVGLLAMLGAILSFLTEIASRNSSSRKKKQEQPKTVTIHVDKTNITIKAEDIKDIENVLESLQKSHFSLEDEKITKESSETGNTENSNANTSENEV